MPSEQESFWDADNYAVITDRTKPAMKWTIHELKRSGKNVYTIDLSEKPEEGALRNVSELPDGIQRAVIGVTKTRPEDMVDALEQKGIKEIWLHWMTETPEAQEKCRDYNMHLITGRCPMMYLGHGISMHTMHREIAKLFGKY